MDQRGRKSGAKLGVVTKLPNARPKPPANFDADQAVVWKRVAASMPAGWFTTATLPLLEDYAERIVERRFVAAQIRALKVLDPDLESFLAFERYKTLCGLRDKETAKITSLARSMRLTQQAQRDPGAGTTAAKRAASGTEPARKPWE